MKQPLFEGNSPAIITPFKEDFIDFEKLGELIEEQIAGGVSAITVCGTTGEASTQSIPEHLAAVEYTVKQAAGRVKVIAGTGSNDTAHALLMSKSAEISGVDGLLMVTPYYNKTSQAGLVKHYTYLADRLHVPIILYNVPGRTGLSLTAETYYELSKHPLINGVKEASGDLGLIARTRMLCGDELNIWSGNDDQIVALMSLGAKGVISVLSNICPQVVTDIAKHCLDGNFKEAAALQVKYMELIDALFIEVNPIPVKTAMNLLGKNVGPLRMPLCEMGENALAVLKKALVNAGFTLS